MNEENKTINLANQILQQESTKKEALSLLLDEYLSMNNRIFVEKTEMGGTESYLGSVTLDWVAGIRYASMLPLFRDKINPETRQVNIDKSTIDLVLQRPLDWTRQAQLAQYLAARKNHKFPPILVVISAQWVDKPEADEWDSNKRAIKSAVDFQSLDSQGRVGLLNVSEDFSIFALDGQHRLMGIQGLMDFIKKGELHRKKRNSVEEKGPSAIITIDDLQNEHGVSLSYIQKLASERIGIEFISAVVAGETREEARRRVRSIFVHVNRMAAPLAKGQLAQLDEDDGFAIIARRVAVSHPLLSQPENRVDYNASNISERSQALTVLQILKEMAYHYLRHDPQFSTWRQSEKGLISLRPEDEDLDNGEKIFLHLWDLLATIPSYMKLERGLDTGSLRRFKHDKNPGEGHMLFRPKGQEVLAITLGELIHIKNQDIDMIFKKIRKYDQDGGFVMHTEQSAWFMVLYDPNKKRMIKGEKLAARLLVYMLGGGLPDPDELEKLRSDFAEARTIAVGDHEGDAMGFDGKWTIPSEINLPPIVRV